MKYPKNLTGLMFGALTVIDCDDPSYTKSGQKCPRFKCKCECGRVVSVLRSSLVRGVTKSCGCRSFNEKQKAMKEARLKRQDAQEHARLKCQEALGIEIDKASNVVHLNCDMLDFTPDNLWYTKNAPTINSRLDKFRGIGFRRNDDGSFVTDTPELMSCVLMLFKLQDLIRSNGGVV